MSAAELPETVAIAALADLLDLSERQVRNVMAAARVSPHSRGQWPLAPAIRGALELARARDEHSPLTVARARAVNAQARERELRIAREEGRLVEADALETVFVTVMAAIVAELDGVAARSTRDVATRRRIEAEIHQARNRMARAVREAAQALENGEIENDDDDNI